MRKMNFSREICKENFRVAGAEQRRASLKGSQSGECRPPRPREGFEFHPRGGGVVAGGALLADK